MRPSPRRKMPAAGWLSSARSVAIGGPSPSSASKSIAAITRQPVLTLGVIRLLLLLVVLPVTAHADGATAVYAHACARCHGETGHGDGPAVAALRQDLSPRPRDFTRGKFKFRSTASGQLPTDADLLRTIARGVPRYMPAFTTLSAKERRLAMTAVKRFFPGFERPTAATIAIPAPPPTTPDAVTRGAALYRDSGCASCHGDDAGGNGPSAKDLKDGSGFRIQPADLRLPQRFKNGRTAKDIYRTLTTGLDDTPMASYADALTVAQRWDLIAFVRSLGRRARPTSATAPATARPLRRRRASRPARGRSTAGRARSAGRNRSRTSLSP